MTSRANKINSPRQWSKFRLREAKELINGATLKNIADLLTFFVTIIFRPCVFIVLKTNYSEGLSVIRSEYFVLVKDATVMFVELQFVKERKSIRSMFHIYQ